MLMGSMNVPAAEPNRLIAVTRPIPDPRTSVGKSSGGYTWQRLLTAEIIRVKITNKMIIRGEKLLGKTLSKKREIVRVTKEPIKKPLRENLIVSQMPRNASITKNTFNNKSIVKFSLILI